MKIRICLLGFMVAQSLWGQTPFYIQTSQPMYSVLDRIRFTVLVKSETTDEISVMQFALMDSLGETLYSGMAPVVNGCAEAAFRVEVNIPSGCYWLLVSGPETTLMSQPIWLLNPLRNSWPLLKSNSNATGSQGTLNDSMRVASQRSWVQIDWQVDHGYTHYLLTVYPDYMDQLAQKQKVLFRSNEETKSHFFILHGKLLNHPLEEPLYVTTLDASPQFWEATLDSAGAFEVMLPAFENESTLLFQSTSPSPVRIDINKPIWNVDEGLESNSLPLDSNQIQQFMQESDIRLAFDHFVILEKKSLPVYDQGPFYGKADHSYQLADYVDMSLRDFLFEVVKEISLSRTSGERVIRVQNPNAVGTLENAPLVLFDGIIIQDHSEILSVNSGLIESIHIVDRPYLIGGKVWGGIVHFTSIDRTGLDVLESSRAVAVAIPGYTPLLYDASEYPYEKDNRIPDFRHNLSWIPTMKLNTDKVVTTPVPTGDLLGPFVVKFVAYNPITGKYSEHKQWIKVVR